MTARTVLFAVVSALFGAAVLYGAVLLQLRLQEVLR